MPANISRCRTSHMEKYKRQDDLPGNRALFSMLAMEELSCRAWLMDGKAGMSAQGDRGCCLWYSGASLEAFECPQQALCFVVGKKVHEGTLGCLLHRPWWWLWKAVIE